MEKLKICAAGPDELSPKLLRKANLDLNGVLKTLFNACLTWSFTLRQWCIVNITPIQKPIPASYPPEFRPIAITSSLGKVFERII